MEREWEMEMEMEMVAGFGRRKTMAFERLQNASCLGFGYINILTFASLMFVFLSHCDI